ncbi:MAG: helix-turn-helix transcriptional regulator [Gammaproteobacteria bacterium]|nr:helix-turn-helix transcriptional regulator [Gammaproteobacteria bacterium]
MATQDAFDRTLMLLYEAALTDDKWVMAAASINEVIGANGHSLSYANPSPPANPEVLLSRFFVGPERRDDMEELYFRDYYRCDEAIPRLHGLRDGELAYRSDLYTQQEKKTSVVYNEFRCTYGTQHGLYVGLDGLEGGAVVLSLGNSTEGGSWGHGQIRTIKRLAPHLRQFARARHAMAQAGALSASLSALLENGRSGFIQLDRRGRILEANDRARKILLERDGLRDAGGVLAAGMPAENAELQRRLATALPPHGSQAAGGSMKITRTKTRTPLVLEVCPVRTESADRREGDVAALVLLVDPAARPRIDPAFAAKVLGLSPAESRVAVDLAAGRTIAGIAAELGCAESTVRTHVRRTYRKLSVRKQTDLVRRIMSLEALTGSRR